ncbi:hypothetical protein HK096_010632, partial [Nowakowskiella sp. JEL0078]
MNLPIQIHSSITYSISTESVNSSILHQTHSKPNGISLNDVNKNEETEDLSVSDDTDSSATRISTSNHPTTIILPQESPSTIPGNSDQFQTLISSSSPTKSESLSSLILPEELNQSKLTGNGVLMQAGRRKK